MTPTQILGLLLVAWPFAGMFLWTVCSINWQEVPWKEVFELSLGFLALLSVSYGIQLLGFPFIS